MWIHLENWDTETPTVLYYTLLIQTKASGHAPQIQRVKRVFLHAQIEGARPSFSHLIAFANAQRLFIA